MWRNLKEATQYIQRYGYNEAAAANKERFITEAFAEVVRRTIPEATDEQIAALQTSLEYGGELRLTNVYDMQPVAPFMSTLPRVRRL